MNLALATVLGSSIQTALLNTPLVVFVGWGLGYGMDLNFEVFNAIVLILAILVVGGFLRDAKTNYLEGVLCVLVYIIIAIAAFYYPNPHDLSGTASGETSALTSSAVGAEATGAAHRRF
jgi:Ca2+:H+ antiporter